MAILEAQAGSKEVRKHEWDLKGMILVLAHHSIPEDPHILVVVHKANIAKGIAESEIGLPSETIKVDEGETPAEALVRALAEEVGIEDPEALGLYQQRKRSKFKQKLNLSTGLNGDSSNAVAYGRIFWVPDPNMVLRNFEQSYQNGVVDRKEVRTVDFVRASHLLNTPFAVRTAPNPRYVISNLQTQGLLRHPLQRP
jgi:hypothetical protein